MVSLLLASIGMFGFEGPRRDAPMDVEAGIDALVRPIVGRQTPGIAIVVQQGEKTLYRKGLGHTDRAGKIPAITSTPYGIASLTKSFTAALIQKLASERKLKLDDSVSKHLPALGPTWSGVTVRHLLHHTSGMPEYTRGLAAKILAGKVATPGAIVAWTAAQTSEFAPGAKFAYRNTNYYLLGLIAERAGGAPLETQFRTRIFAPLGMKSAVLPRSGTSVPGEAEGSVRVGGTFVAARKLDASWPFAAGAIVANADDMARWIKGISRDRVLTKAQREEAFTAPQFADGKTSSYGYGWVLGHRESAPMIVHAGEIDGFASYVAYLPESDVRLVLLTNSHAVDTQTLAFGILDIVEGKTIAPTIEDADPALTTRLRGVVDRMLKGERDPAEFDPGFLKAIPDEAFARFGKGLGANGSVAEFLLLKDERSDSGRTRTYRLEIGQATMMATFTLMPDGKISGLGVR